MIFSYYYLDMLLLVRDFFLISEKKRIKSNKFTFPVNRKLMKYHIIQTPKTLSDNIIFNTRFNDYFFITLYIH